MHRFAVLLLTSLVLAACSKPTPPVGRWTGTYESQDMMVDARLEIEKNGLVRVSAPYVLNIANASAEDRTAMHQRLAAELADDWDEVAPRPMDFDGEVFRKPGGVAPQMEWNRHTKDMKIVVYFTTHPALHFPVHAVGDFTNDPWSH